MSGEDLKKLRFLFFVVSVFAFGADGFRLLQMLSEEEELELNRQLKQLNKPAIKSFKVICFFYINGDGSVIFGSHFHLDVLNRIGRTIFLCRDVRLKT